MKSFTQGFVAVHPTNGRRFVPQLHRESKGRGKRRTRVKMRMLPKE